MLTIDGAQGEGGGQIVRTALALSTCLGKPFRIENIRANRRRPGLQPQHLAAVRAAARISVAEVTGAEKDAQILEFKPHSVVPGEYEIDIGTAGSTSLVLQTVLPGLLLAGGRSRVRILGGTHNPMAPPFEFLQYAFLPALRGMGANVDARLTRIGFAPQGGGQLEVDIEPLAHWQPLSILERGELVQRRAEVLLANLPVHIAERELAIIGERLAIPDTELHYTLDTRAASPGNLVSIILRSTQITACFTALGKRGLPAEQVAEQAVQAAQRYLDANVPVEAHLADQLLIYLALAGAGRFVTTQPSSHTLTNMAVINAFTGVSIRSLPVGNEAWQISCCE